ncbi:MAG: membrane-bound lytic murein transglycosylase F [Oceanicoccus sp.]|jgi:membrane-bound lytic murein transglycosylase F
MPTLIRKMSLRLLQLITLLLVSGYVVGADNESDSSSKNVLRILTWSGSENYLPRVGKSGNIELAYLEQFAELNQFDLETIYVDKRSQLIPSLQQGIGDLIASNLTVTDHRAKIVDFSNAIGQVTEFLVQSSTAEPIQKNQALNGLTLALHYSTSFNITARGLKNSYPDLNIVYVDERMSNESLLDAVADGRYDLTILDDNTLKNMLRYRKDIKKSLQANSKKDVAWAIRPGNGGLLQLLDLFIDQQINSKKNTADVITAWDRIIKRNKVRFVMRNNISSYYIRHGQLMGFNYDIARSFAREHKLQYEIVVAPDNSELVDYILEDKADIALAFLTPTEYRIKQGIDFTRPYHHTDEVLVSRSKDDISNVQHLSGRSIAIRNSSAYWSTLNKLREKNPSITMTAVDEDIETEEIIEAVGNGKYDLTIADRHILKLEQDIGIDVKAAFTIGDKKTQGWAVKQGNDILLDKANQYLKKYYKGLFYNVTYNKYFRNLRRIKDHHSTSDQSKKSGNISPYDGLVKKYAERYNFDSKLLISQMYQESHFKATATSFAGAKGLFQLMPATAKQMGFNNVTHPESGIHAGIKYMDWLRERLSYYDIDEDQKIWFNVAAYNAGFGHLSDAISLARKKGWRDDQWFGEVEKAMLLLSQQKYARQARFGFVRGSEPVNYVRSVRHRYQAYKSMN